MEGDRIKSSYKLKQNERIQLENSQDNAGLNNVRLNCEKRTNDSLDDMNRVGCIEIVN